MLIELVEEVKIHVVFDDGNTADNAEVTVYNENNVFKKQIIRNRLKAEVN